MRPTRSSTLGNRRRRAASRSPDTTACTPASARSTSCRSSRSAATMPRAAAALDARAFGAWWAETLRGTGVLLRRRRPSGTATFRSASRRVRRAAARLRAAGSASRARRDGSRRAPPLVAINCVLDDRRRCDRPRASRARCASETAALPGVRALGFLLERRAHGAGVDEPRSTSTAPGSRTRAGGARTTRNAAGPTVAVVELVGLVPAAELDRCSRDFLRVEPDSTPQRRRAIAGRGWSPGVPAGRTRARRWRGRGGRGRAGGGCGGAPARTSRPRCRTSRRAGARTRGTRP